MSADMPLDRPLAARPPARPRPRREVIYRHTVVVRLTHWVNAAVIFLLIGTGLNIFNAHPQLYWGRYGSEFDHAFLSIHAMVAPGGATRGELVVGPLHLDTTGVLGWSQGRRPVAGSRLARVAHRAELHRPG